MTQLHTHHQCTGNNNHNANGCDTVSDPELLKIPIIGSRGVGKTSLVEQFVYCEIPDKRIPTESPQFYYPVVLFNERLYNIRLIDCPLITYFPTSSMQEWTDFRGCCLRSASAFILVFDASSEESFQYIRDIREQIIEQAMDVPIVVVANKVDLAAGSRFLENNGCGVLSSSNGGNGLRHLNSSVNGGTISGGGTSGTVANAALLSSGGFLKRDVVNLVKKQWKGTVLVECSAKYNWRVLSVFKELMKLIDNRDSAHKPTAARAVQDALRRNRCIVM